MQCAVHEALHKLDAMDGIIRRIDDGKTLDTMDIEIIRELLEEYRDVLTNARVKI